MSWMKVETRVRTHPKIVQAGPAAAWLWFCGNCYCREHLTDGFIPKGMVTALVPVDSDSPAKAQREAKRDAVTLVTVGLWHEAENGYQVHDFLDWNPSRADVDAIKEWDRRRKELYADKALVHEIRQRDGDFCRYCQVEVRWSDRRGPQGGQFDHVIPRGPNTLENVVVACRGCNIKKNNRTPEQAGMPLLPPKNQIGIKSGSSSDLGGGSKPVTRVAGASISTSTSDSDAFLDEGPGETRPVRQAVQGRGAFGAGELQRDHLRHAVCGPGYRICLKDWEFAEFVRQYGAPEPEARPVIEAFIAKLTTALGDHQSPGGFKQIEKDFQAHLRAIGRVSDGPRLTDAAPAGASRHDQKLRDINEGKFGRG